MKYPLIASLLGLLALTLPMSPARAQGHVGYGFASGGRSGVAISRRGPSAHRFVGGYRGRRFYSHSALSPNFYPYYDPYFESYYDPEDAPDVAPPPPPPAWQSGPSPAPATSQKPVESLVMELRGDRWVRLTNYGAEDTGTQSAESQSALNRTSKLGKPSGASEAPPVSELPPAVLVFRDGHQEQAAKYTIVGGTIHIKGDYWTTGSWTRAIPVAELNLAATLQLNQQRGVKFNLPSRPSEVIVR